MLKNIDFKICTLKTRFKKNMQLNLLKIFGKKVIALKNYNAKKLFFFIFLFFYFLFNKFFKEDLFEQTSYELCIFFSKCQLFCVII